MAASASSRDNWFRNGVWDDEIAAAFDRRLGRVRNKAQYLRIQAGYLGPSYPGPAIELLDQYFAMGGDVFAAQAHVQRAEILIRLGNFDGAVEAYEDAFSSEQSFPSVMTQAYVDLPVLVASARLPHLYFKALDILDENKHRPTFPVERFRANGARALILEALDRPEMAREAARAALQAAYETQSDFSHHKGLGLVTDLESEFARRVIAAAD